MATKEQLNSITENLNQIPEITQTCYDIASALIECKEKVFSGNVWGLIFPTEYDRARKQVISTCVSTIRELKNVRRTVLSPEAIRATSYLNHVENRCRACLAENKKRMAEGKSFCCLVRDASDKISSKGFRFKLNKKGDVVAQK